MARSIGEAAAQALESGFRLATDYSQRQRQNEREDAADRDAQETKVYNRDRQQRADQLSGLNAQETMLREEGMGYQNAPTPPDAATMQDYTQRVRGLNSAKSGLLAKTTGYDVAKQQQQGAIDLEHLNTGDMAALKPGQLSRATTVATGRPPSDYVRAGGKAAPVEQAANDFIEGLHGDDQPRMLAGLNTMFAPEMRTGVGGPAMHDGKQVGKIVGKQIVDLHPDPRAPKEDPHVVPMVRVYFSDGSKLNGPLPQGAPAGATGYYDAPLTKNRSSDPNDPVKSIGVNEATEYIGKQMQVVETLNTPEALAQFQKDAEAGDFDPNEYLQALATAGVKPKAKGKTIDKVVPRGSVLIRQRVDDQDNPIGEPTRIEGNPMTYAPRSPGAMQQELDAIDNMVENGELSQEEGEAAKKARVSRATAPRPAGRSGGSGGGIGKGGNLQSTKVDNEGYLLGVFRNGDVKRLQIDGKPVKSQDIEKRIDKLAESMGKGINGLGKSPEELREMASKTILGNAAPVDDKPAGGAPAKGKPGGLNKDQAAKQFGF